MSATTAAICAAAVGLRAVVDIDPDRPVVFADAVDAAGDVEFGAERDLEESVDDLGVGEGLALGGAAFRDLGVFGGGRRLRGQRRSATSDARRMAAPSVRWPLGGAASEPAERHDVVL